MTGDFYGQMQGIATGLLTQFNQGTIVLQQLTPGTGPAANPGAPTVTPVALKGAVKGVSSRYIMRGLANEGDLEVTVAVVAGVTPNQPLDKILIGSQAWKIVQFEKIPAAGTTVTWKFIVRR